MDIPFDFEETKVELPEISNVVEYLKKMQFYTFVKNIDSILCSFDKNCEGISKKIEEEPSETIVQFKDAMPAEGQVQLGLFSTVVKETVEKETYESKIIATDTELAPLVQEILTRDEIAISFISDFFSFTCFFISIPLPL